MSRSERTAVWRVVTTCLLAVSLSLTAVAHLSFQTWPETKAGLEEIPTVAASENESTAVLGDKTRKSSSEGFDTSPRAARIGQSSFLPLWPDSCLLAASFDERVPQTLVFSALTIRAPPSHS
jgi:hypothetical protein